MQFAFPTEWISHKMKYGTAEKMHEPKFMQEIHKFTNVTLGQRV
jgi:hypothetical protein